MEENNDFEEYKIIDESNDSSDNIGAKSSSILPDKKNNSSTKNESLKPVKNINPKRNNMNKSLKGNNRRKNPVNQGINKLTKNFPANKATNGLGKIANLKGSNSNKDKTKERINNTRQKGNLFSNGKKDNVKNTKESNSKTPEKKSGLSNLSGEKKNGGNNKGKLATAAHIAKNPKKAAIEAGINLAKMIWEKKKKKIIMGIVAGAAAVFISVVFIFEVIMGPLMDAFQKMDKFLTDQANFAEKLDNFYSGFGFQDSKEAFYDELDSLCDRYGCSNDGTGLDVPLLLATLFYTEGMGYDTSYSQIEESGVIDASMNSGSSNSSLFSTIKEYFKGKFDEAHQTVDENGLVYNVGKIYRLRKLARNQFHTNAYGIATRSGQPKTVSLKEFVNKYVSNIAKDYADMLLNASSALVDLRTLIFNELGALIVGSEYSGTFFDNAGQVLDETRISLLQVLGDIFYGLADIVDISSDINGVSVTYYDSYTYEEDNYKNYLFDYYFENMPEYKEMLKGYSGDNLLAQKEYLFREINDNKKLFESVFLEYQQESSEDYVESCVGAINQKLVSELNMPVDIPDNITISFDDNYSYGIVNGKSHNGVDLNETTAGVKLGSKVYAVANGKIDSIEETKCSNEKKCGKSIKIKHNLVLDNEEYKFFTIYSNVTLKSGLKKGSTISKGDEIGTIYNNSDNIEGLHFAFLDANTDDKGIEIDPTNIFIQCSTAGDDWLIHQSAFTKSEFIQKIQNYCKNSGCDDDLQMFADNADFIYDVSKKNNISPELVVVRASNEGFSPGGGTNNYWGIGCFNNDPSSCLSYSSFEEGIKGFANLDIVKNANTASEMMMKYAYIGDYWINPGGSDNGGCHYYPYINGYMSTSRSNIVAGYCSAGKECSGSNCGKTTEEDQIAYSKWQVESQLLGFRKEYFGY